MTDLTIEPDPEPRNGPYHKRIIRSRPVPNTKTGKFCDLECGHVVMTFGDLELAKGVCFCMKCREEESDDAGS